ncbi:MAG: DUF4982 domain-containing protein [Prevotella sp.]|nr:DUF4982 domain-containing protein [Prevotella sp.]
MRKLVNHLLRLFLLTIAGYSQSISGMEIVSLNHGWRFCKGVELRTMQSGEPVDLPHTWNANDAMYGNQAYYRGMATYSRMIKVNRCPGKRYFLRVNAAQTVADVFIDNHFVMQHRGGYTAFVAELTPLISDGCQHKLDIRVSNAQTTDVAPLSGDFNIYGGLYRGVDLLITNGSCIRPDYYASDGVLISQLGVSKEKAVIEAKAFVYEDAEHTSEMHFKLYAGKQIVGEQKTAVKNGIATASLTIVQPHLWDGVNDPHLYQAVISLVQGGKTVDDRVIPVGFRFFHADPNEGFSLNGRKYTLRGACVHQDRAEFASAYQAAHFTIDLNIAQEMGCNALRLAHYPHSQEMYNQMDKRGLVAWTEVPFVNIFISNPAFEQNLQQQMLELVMQYYNHPCILFWGLFNEANSGWMENVEGMVRKLNILAHQLDKTRMTIAATNQDDIMNGIPDMIAYNKYFGWYSGKYTDMAEWLDKEHAKHPEYVMGISEYGAGGSIYQQQDTLSAPSPYSRWHPENVQTDYHITNYKYIRQRPWLWCSFVWCLFDFSSVGRNEGFIKGRNDKGLVSYDRTERKDAYYFYRANWNKDIQTVYIAGRHNNYHTSEQTNITVFCNGSQVELFVNGISQGRRKPNEVKVATWKGVKLQKGNNQLTAKCGKVTDKCMVKYR